MRDISSPSGKHKRDVVTHVAQGVVEPGATVPFLLGSYEQDVPRSLNLRITPVEVADYAVRVHRDQYSDQTLWCKVHNRGEHEIYVETSVLGGSDASNPAA